MVEDDFSNYLYDHGFNQFEWRVLQDQNSDQALSLLGEYSDQLFDRMVKDVKYLEFRSDRHLRVIECHKDYMVSIGIELPERSIIDLTNIESLKEVDPNEQYPYKCFKEKRPYNTDRDQDIFDLIESGCYVVDSFVFEQLNLLRVSFQN